MPSSRHPAVPITTRLGVPLLLAACLGLAPAAAAGESRITAVKLYPGSATVERTLSVAPGTRQAVFSCLPGTLDTGNLQVAADSGISVGEIRVQQQPRALLRNRCSTPLDERIRTLEDRIAVLEAEHTALEYAGAYLRSFGDRPEAEGTGPGQQIDAVVRQLRDNGQATLLRQHQIAREREALETELHPLQAERDRLGGPDTPLSTVQVTLVTLQGGELRLRYQVSDTGWQPVYRASLDSDSGRIELERLAQVTQRSGEDWTNVPLTLSTGHPTAATEGPLPRPWRVGVQPPETAAVRKAAPAPMAEVAGAMAADARAASPFDASVLQGSFATEFLVPQPVTVDSGADSVDLRLERLALDAELIVRSTPALDPNAYLIASFQTPDGVWPAGRVSLYRDGAYVGSSRFDAAQASHSGFAFGRDELVTVRVERPEQQHGKSGIIAGRNQRTDARRYVLENRHDRTISLQVLDAAPVSEHQDVQVKSDYQPQPQATEWNGQRGTVAWEQELESGATQAFSSTHTISWPRNEELRERR